MIIAVTGGTGFVGRAIVRELRAGGHRVRAIVRDPPRARWLADELGAELFPGNLLDAASLAGALAGANAVIHLVGIIVERGANTFDRAHTVATGNVVAAMKRAGLRRYLHMSALGTRADARSRYHQTKWAAEEQVRQSGLAWTIFRPSMIYGRQDQAINVLARVVRRLPVVPVLGDGRAKIQPVDVEQVARCFAAALRHDGTIGRTYDLCGPVPFTWNELNDKLLAFYGLQKPKLHLPLALARPLAAVFERLLPHPPFTRDQLLMTQEDNVGDPQPAARDLGLAAESFEQGLARMLVK